MAKRTFNKAVTVELQDMDNPFIDDSEVSVIKPSSKNLFYFTRGADISLMLLGFVAAVVSALGSPAQAIVLGRLFIQLGLWFRDEYDKDWSEYMRFVGIYSGSIAIVGVVKALAVWLMAFCWMKHGEKQQKRARKLIFDKFIRQANISWAENFKNMNGELSQLNRCVEEVRLGNAEVVGMLVHTVVGCIACFIVAMAFSWSITLVTLCTTPVVALSSWFFGNLAYKYAGKENLASAACSKVINWCLLNPAIPRMFNGKDQELVNFESVVNRSSKNFFKLQNVTYIDLALLKTIVLLMFVQGFWFGVTRMRLHNVGINDMVTAFTCCLVLSAQLSTIANVLGLLYKSQAAAGRVISFLSQDTGSNDSIVNKIKPNRCNGDIAFYNVDFKYQSKPRFVVKKCSMELKPNMFNFVVGRSGSGKSTIAQLLMNFYQPSQGEITIDGMDIKSIDPAWLNDNVSYISSNPVIFTKSLRENIAMALADRYDSIDEVPSSKITDACSFALLDGVIAKIGGLDREISQSSLSGGERQRVAIARAYLRNTSVLIIDEGLNSLDVQNRQYLFHALKEWRKGMTTIFITHELSQIGSDDYVVLIEDGTAKRQGYMRDLSGEELFLNTNFSDAVSDSTYDSMDDEKMDSESEVVTKLPRYHFLKSPSIAKDLSSVAVGRDEKIYSISTILRYYFKTMNMTGLVLIGLFFSVVYAVTVPFFSYLVARLLNNMISTFFLRPLPNQLRTYSIALIVVSLIHGIAYYVSHFLLGYSSEKWVNKLRKRALAKLNDQDLHYFNRDIKPSEINALLMNDTRDLRTLISKFLSIALNLVVMVVLGLVFSFIFGWKMTLVGLAFVVLIMVATFLYSGVIQRKETRYKDKINDLEYLSYETLNGVKTINAMNLQKFFYDDFEFKMQKIDKASTSRAVHSGVAMAFTGLITSIALAILMYYGMRLAGRQEYTILQFMQVLSFMTLTFSHATQLLNELPDITRGQRCATYLFRLLELPSSPTETAGEAQPAVIAKNEVISFMGVNFRYRSKDVLKDVSFSVHDKDIFGIVGESGSGKSTIINLITRLYGDYEGAISVNRTDLQAVDPYWLREYISIVPQSPIFFEGTIYDNLTYGMSKSQLLNPNIEEFLKLCNIHSFVESLPEGLQTNIGTLTESSLISSGQLQRLSIVRAIMRKPQVLILDECTSNLDVQNFNLIKDLIVKLNQELSLTIILVSHSPELLSITTRSIKMRNGRVQSSN